MARFSPDDIGLIALKPVDEEPVALASVGIRPALVCGCAM